MLSVTQLRDWHLKQAEHFEHMAYIHTGFADSANAEKYGLRERYSDRAKEYRKQAAWHTAAVETLTNTGD